MNTKHLVLGGTGFVGTQIAKLIVQQGGTPLCVSRSGERPGFLNNADWANEVEWLNVNDQDAVDKSFAEAETLFCLVGSPPVPTFSRCAQEAQTIQNSQPNLDAIAKAKNSDIKQVVVLGAHLPKAINRDSFGYAKGKRLCLEAARTFAESSSERGAAVLQPTAIFGTRYTKGGKPINLGSVMSPLSDLQKRMPSGLKNFLPELFVPVEAVALVAVSAALDENYRGRFSVISNQEIIKAMDDLTGYV